MKFDAIVIGAGISGFAAACAIKKAGKSVGLLYADTGATSVSSGAWDFGSVKQPAPLLNTKLAEAAKDTADNLSSGFMQFQFQDPFCLPTTSGRWRLVYAAQFSQAVANLNAFSGKKISLLGSSQWRWEAKAISQRLQAEAKKIGREITVDPLLIEGSVFGNDLPLSHLASRIQADEDFRKIFFQLVCAKAKELDGLFLLPPVFIQRKHFEFLSTALPLPVAECLATLEPLAGYRLHSEILLGLAHANIPVKQVSQIKPVIAEKIIGKLKFNSNKTGWEEWEAKRFILATGKYFSGGVQLGYHNIRESIFSLPLFKPSSSQPIAFRSQLNWNHQEFRHSQDWETLGLRIDSQWQPVDVLGKPVLENLFACGSGIGGKDLAHARLGLGYLAFTGKECGDVVAKI